MKVAVSTERRSRVYTVCSTVRALNSFASNGIRISDFPKTITKGYVGARTTNRNSKLGFSTRFSIAFYKQKAINF